MTGPRVVLTTDVVGGVWDFCMALATALRDQRAADVTLLALGEPSPSQRQQAAQARAHLVSQPLKLEWMQDADMDVVRTRQLVAQVVREVRADVLHANQFAAACADVEVPVILTIHSDVLSWSRWTYGVHEVPAEWRAYAQLVGGALGAANEVVAVTDFLANEVQLLYQTRRPVRVIHNGWPAPQAAPVGQREHITLLAGRVWDAAKNVALAAEAAGGWDPGGVFLAGEQTHPDSGAHAAVPPPIRSLGLLDRPDLDAWLRRSAIYLSPARYDPFGLLPLQAALNGCALLLSDIPSYRELWDGAACFFGSDDAAHLSQQWQQLLADPERLADLSQRATHRATSRYTPARMLEAYTNLYARANQRAIA